MRITFRKLIRRAWEAKIYDIRVDGQDIGCIQEIRGSWFWYANYGDLSINTSADPKTLEECKAEIKDTIRRAEFQQ